MSPLNTADLAIDDNEQPPLSSILAGYVTEHELAAVRGVTRRALRAERQRREGPPYVVLNRRIFYPRDGVRAWLKQIEQHPAGHESQRRASRPAARRIRNVEA